MPDLKSELKKLEALKFDDDGDTTVITLQPAVALPDNQQGGVSVRMFNIIRDNPGCNRNKLITLADTVSVSRASSSSLLNQFVKRGLVRTVDSQTGLTYFAVGQKYKPGYIKQAKKAAKVATPKAAKPEPQPTAIAPVSLAVFSAKDMVESMPVGKARAVYDELKKLFGG
jgi:hypothetical protein